MAPVNAFDAWMTANQELVFGGAIAIMGLVTCVLGGGFMAEGRRGLVIMRESEHWPTVPGEITASSVSERTSFSDGLSTDYYEPAITYTYRVNGKQYEGFRVLATTFQESTSEPWAQSWVEAYYVGRPVVVFYNPKRPKEALLEPGKDRSESTAREKIGCGLSMFLFGAGCFAALYFLLTRGG